MQQIRRQVLREDFGGLNLCRDCKQPYSPNFPIIDREELEQLGGKK
jgi:hypothetical protein